MQLVDALTIDPGNRRAHRPRACGDDQLVVAEILRQLPVERLALRARGEGGADVGDVAERAAQNRGGGDGADELGREPTGGICYRAAPAQLV
jgi:hypothetical protein